MQNKLDKKQMGKTRFLSYLHCVGISLYAPPFDNNHAKFELFFTEGKKS